MKKVIRLTESDLHRIVENTTKRLHSEISWELQANAAKAAQKKTTQEQSIFMMERWKH